MDRTPTTSHPHLGKVRDLTHRGVDTVFNGAETVIGLAPALKPQKLTTAALRSGLSAVGRMLPFGDGSAERPARPRRTPPPGPDIVTPQEPTAPAADGVAAALAERRRPRPRPPAKSVRPAPSRPLDEPDELVYSTGADSP
jgi:hypothetical protein